MKYFIEEEGSALVRTLVTKTLPTTSRLSAVEIASALCRRCREGDISESDRDQALELLNNVFADLYVVEVTPAVTESAQQLLQRFTLRAGDAIQLASYLLIQARAGESVQFSGFDQRLVEAAREAGS